MKYLIYILLATGLIQACSSGPKTLPILGERQTVEKVIDGKTVIDTVYQHIPAFSYLNQDSVYISNADFDGSIYVADFFFTSCNTICPIMHRNMLTVLDKYKGNEHVKFLSHSIDTKYDWPNRLKKYATKLGVTGNQWQFVHGSKDSIYSVAAKSYLVAAYEDGAAPQGLVHQGWFVLIDKEKRIRGAYDGTKTDQVAQLMSDMDLLLQEYEQK